MLTLYKYIAYACNHIYADIAEDWRRNALYGLLAEQASYSLSPLLWASHSLISGLSLPVTLSLHLLLSAGPSLPAGRGNLPLFSLLSLLSLCTLRRKEALWRASLVSHLSQLSLLHYSALSLTTLLFPAPLCCLPGSPAACTAHCLSLIYLLTLIIKPALTYLPAFASHSLHSYSLLNALPLRSPAHCLYSLLILPHSLPTLLGGG